MKPIKQGVVEIFGRQATAYRGYSATFLVSDEQIILIVRNKTVLAKLARELIQCKVARRKFKEVILIEAPTDQTAI